jgi:AcrR family transcriptional regulator
MTGSKLDRVGPEESPVAAPRPGTALRWEAHKEETRRKLLASAHRLFAERGFQATSAADIAADAGVTERTLFRYFSSKSALVLDEAFSLLPEMFEVVRNRPAQEPPYEAVGQGILEFFKDHNVLFVQVMAAPGVIDLPVSGRQRTLIDFEELLARVLHDRYALPQTDQVTAAVWARASIGAIRTALGVLTGTRTADGLPKGAFADAIRVCFATLSGTWPPENG